MANKGEQLLPYSMLPLVISIYRILRIAQSPIWKPLAYGDGKEDKEEQQLEMKENQCLRKYINEKGSKGENKGEK